MLGDRYEPFIAWRYLYRRRRSRGLTLLTVGCGLLWLLGLLAAFGLHGDAQLVGIIVSLPALILFVFFALLNLVSGFTAVSIVGVAIGVLALVVVLAVTSGFQQAFRQKVLGVNAHVDVMKYGLDFSEYREIIEKLRREPHVVAASPFVFADAMLAAGQSMSGTEIKGIDPIVSPSVLDIESAMRQGSIAQLVGRGRPSDGGDPLPGIVVGQDLAKKLKLKLGDRTRIVIPRTDFGVSGRPPEAPAAARQFRVVGVFHAGFEEYDTRLAYVSLKEAQALNGGEDVATGVEARIDDLERAMAVKQQIDKSLGGAPYHVIEWEELNRNLFAALKMQKAAISVILTLIIIVAAFNIIAAMTMLVVGKAREIAILKSMGMRSAGVARLFQLAGFTIGASGTLLGILIGLITTGMMRRYDYMLDPHVYLIDKLPVKVNPDEVLLTIAITLAICLVATTFPAMKAARLSPVEGLRYQ